jgi:hypothetical protein
LEPPKQENFLSVKREGEGEREREGKKGRDRDRYREKEAGTERLRQR